MTETAEADLAEIWAYLALEASEVVATRFVREIEAKFQPILDMPLMGALRDQFSPALRVIFHGRYSIYYVAQEGELVIVRVIHSARDAAAIAEHGGFKE